MPRVRLSLVFLATSSQHMFGPIWGVRMATLVWKVIFLGIECVVSSALVVALSCCFCFKLRWCVLLSRIKLVGCWCDVGVEESKEKHG